MKIFVVLFISWRYIFGKKQDRFNQCIYWVSNICMVLNMSAMIVILSVMNGFERELKNNLLYFTPHITITSSYKCVHVNNIPNFLSNELLSNSITYMKPLIISDVILQSSKKILLGSMLGIDPNHFEPLLSRLVINNMYQLIPKKYFIIIGSELAKQLSVNVHDQIRLIIPSINQFTPIGYISSQRLFTISDIYISNDDKFDAYQVLVHIVDAANLMHYPDQHITGWRLWVSDPFKLDKFNNLNVSKDWIWTDWRKYKGSLFYAIKMEKNIMYLLFVLIILISSCNIISFLMLLITDKTKEIAILKTYGFNSFQTVMLFVTQSISIGMLSVIFGSSLGIILSINLNKILFFLNFFSELMFLPIEIQYFQIMSVSLIVCIFMALIVLYPAWRVSSIHPAQVLNHV